MRESLEKIPAERRHGGLRITLAAGPVAGATRGRLPAHSLHTLAIASPAAPAPIQMVGKEGEEGRRKKRKEQLRSVRQSGVKLGLTGSDYIIGRDGRARRGRPGKATANLYNRSRSLRLRSEDLPVNFTSLRGRAASVMSLASSFAADRDTGLDVSMTGAENVGSLTKSNLPWFGLPSDAYNDPGAPSAFAKPVDKKGGKVPTTYHKDEGVFSASTFAKTDERSHAHRTLVSAAESVRGSGAGLAQVIADDVRGSGAVNSRNKMYGTEGSPGYLPGGYSGSQSDIVLTDDHSRDHDYEGVLSNPTGFQTERVLADERRKRVGRLKRTLSNPDLTATEDDHARDSDALFDRIGLSLEHRDRDEDRVLKRSRSLL